MKYAQARNRINPGDLVAIRKRGTVLAEATRFVCKSPYTHTAVAVWVGCGGVRRLMVAEAKASGSFLSPLSQYQGVDFDVFPCPVSHLDAERSLWRLLSAPNHYDGEDLAYIAANRLFGLPLPPADDARKICSSLSAAIYLDVGWRPAGLPSIPAPDDVVRAIGAPPKLIVRKD